MTFTNGGTTVCSDVALSTAPFTATCSADLPGGQATEEVTATYSGDSDHTSVLWPATVQVNRAPTNTSVSASPSGRWSANPSPTPRPLTWTRPATHAAGAHRDGDLYQRRHDDCAPMSPFPPPTPYTATCSQTYRGTGIRDGDGQLLR